MENSCQRLQTIALDQWAEKLKVGDTVKRIWYGDITEHKVTHVTKCRFKIDTGDVYLKEGREFGSAVVVPATMTEEEIKEYFQLKWLVNVLDAKRWDTVSKEKLHAVYKLIEE